MVEEDYDPRSNIPPPTEIITKPVRLQFASLFRPSPVMRNSPDLKYQAVLLMPPDTDLSPYVTAIKAAMIGKFGQEIELKGRAMPLHRCEERPDPRPQGYADGWYYANTKGGFAPGVVDQGKKPILDADLFSVNPDEAVARAERVIYDGCWVRFHLTAYGWIHDLGGRGVSFSLNSVQLIRDDEKFEKRKQAQEVFGIVEVVGDDLPLPTTNIDELF